jgi:hypothetical protein
MGRFLDYINGSPHLVSNQHQIGREALMKDLTIKLWRNPAERNWSIQVNEKRHDFVTLVFAQQFVAHRLADAKKSLMEPETRRTQ